MYEAIYRVLAMNLVYFSRPRVYLSTYKKEKRVRIVKAKNSLENLEGEDTNVFESNLLDFYSKRIGHEQMCLFEFTGMYKKARKSPSRTPHLVDEGMSEDMGNSRDIL